MAPLGKQADFRVSSRPVAQPVKPCGLLRFNFSQIKATVLKVKPHALIRRSASGSWGKVAHKNKRQSFSASVSTGRAHSSSMLMVG